jgi:phosphoglycolate phosphatase-like HAD superfamily hydrolase
VPSAGWPGTDRISANLPLTIGLCVSLITIFDVDGTLVDTNYQHTLAWYRAFRNHGVVIPIWRIHRAIGIGSDRIVELLAGEKVEQQLGEALRDAQGPLYQDMIDEVEPTEGARELLRDLKEAGHAVILASSAEEEEIERYIKLLDAKEFIDGYTTSSDVEESKPKPDIVNAAVSKAGGGSAVMIGDSTWDCKAASGANLPSIGVLTGGFSEQELTEAGATKVFDSVEHLRDELKNTSLDELANA